MRFATCAWLGPTRRALRYADLQLLQFSIDKHKLNLFTFTLPLSLFILLAESPPLTPVHCGGKMLPWSDLTGEQYDVRRWNTEGVNSLFRDRTNILRYPVFHCPIKESSSYNPNLVA